MTRAYADHFHALRHVYLEDSWVLGVEHGDERLSFTLDVVLTTDHPLHVGARPGEQHDYRRATLVVAGSALAYVPSGAPLAVDASGETDSGHIDTFASEDGQVWRLDGDWGSAQVTSPEVTLVLSPVG